MDHEGLLGVMHWESFGRILEKEDREEARGKWPHGPPLVAVPGILKVRRLRPRAIIWWLNWSQTLARTHIPWLLSSCLLVEVSTLFLGALWMLSRGVPLEGGGWSIWAPTCSHAYFGQQTAPLPLWSFWLRILEKKKKFIGGGTIGESGQLLSDSPYCTIDLLVN